MQIVHFDESDSNGVVYPAYDRGVVTCWQVSNDRRFSRIPRSVTAILNFLDLIVCDDPADYRSLPVIIRGNQSPIAIMQFQCRVLQWIRNAILTELRTNAAYDYSL